MQHGGGVAEQEVPQHAAAECGDAADQYGDEGLDFTGQRFFRAGGGEQGQGRGVQQREGGGGDGMEGRVEEEGERAAGEGEGGVAPVFQGVWWGGDDEKVPDDDTAEGGAEGDDLHAEQAKVCVDGGDSAFDREEEGAG